MTEYEDKLKEYQALLGKGERTQAEIRRLYECKGFLVLYDHRTAMDELYGTHRGEITKVGN